jgi:5-hydroxyisourate hydrolase / 2-oxo-4-hydroxy-4-carboxy-5-ureidoimidazoline decarboxylase
MDVKTFNKLDKTEAASMLTQVCGSAKWVDLMLKQIPFSSAIELLEAATENWYMRCEEADWKEAFTHHPRIGDLDQLEKKFASTKDLAGNEQSGVTGNDTATLKQLLEGNNAYEKKYGYIFIVHATGKTGGEMLDLLRDRLENRITDEIHIAMGEQQKITVTRFKKLLAGEDWTVIKPSQLTTHILDTSEGKPAAGVKVKLLEVCNEKWQAIAQGRTNQDGRIADLLPPGKNLTAGAHKLIFDTAFYFESRAVKSFYPRISIQFTISDNEHYHVPLLLNPFGYSTYRGS